MAWNWRKFPDDRVRFSISPHLNHHHTNEHAIAEYLWFEEHLKGAAFRMPQTPELKLELKTTDGVPRIIVMPDHSQVVHRVDVYYSVDPRALTRFWRDGKAVKFGKQWQADCTVMNTEQPIFAYADVVYDTPAKYRTGPRKVGQEFDNSTAPRANQIQNMTFLTWLSKLEILRWGGTAAVYRNANERPIELQDPGVLNTARDLVGGDAKVTEADAARMNPMQSETGRRRIR